VANNKEGHDPYCMVGVCFNGTILPLPSYATGWQYLQQQHLTSTEQFLAKPCHKLVQLTLSDGLQGCQDSDGVSDGDQRQRVQLASGFLQEQPHPQGEQPKAGAGQFCAKLYVSIVLYSAQGTPACRPSAAGEVDRMNAAAVHTASPLADICTACWNHCRSCCCYTFAIAPAILRSKEAGTKSVARRF